MANVMCDHKHGPDLCIFRFCCRCGEPTGYNTRSYRFPWDPPESNPHGH